MRSHVHIDLPAARAAAIARTTPDLAWYARLHRELSIVLLEALGASLTLDVGADVYQVRAEGGDPGWLAAGASGALSVVAGEC